MRGISVVVVALLAAGCEQGKPNVTFNRDDPGISRAYIVLKTMADTAAKGWPGRELHIGLSQAASEADQRATLQHVIDSVSARDTTVLWLRVTSFVPGKPEPGRAEVRLHASIQAIWAPPDTSDPASRSHKAVHRIFYTVIAASPDSSAR